MTEADRYAEQEKGLEIDARTSLPAWDGEPLDLGWAMAVLLD